MHNGRVQRIELKSAALLVERTLIFGWSGRNWVCHRCCILARCSGKFDNVPEALNILLIILLFLCSRNSATWQWHWALLQNTEFWLEFCHGWPLVISIISECFMLGAWVDSSLQLSISVETIHTASNFKPLLEYKT
jgi:hypothetical protein